MLVGLDDTDSLTGGCTTHLTLRLLAAVPELALAGPPRLVRLNPNNPRKTRGNGAVAFTLVRPQGPPRVVGAWHGERVLAYPQGAPVAATEALLDLLWAAVEAHAEPDAGTGLVVADAPPPALAYWKAVRGQAAAPDAGGLAHRRRGDGWGLVGAYAALAWPGPAASWELIAYRAPQRVGTPRAVEPAPLAALDRAVTFHTFDTAARRLACVPHTPCPVLAGLRGRDAASLLAQGLPALRSAAEPFDTWLLWETNQASGDHVTPVQSLAQAPPWGTIEADAVVLDRPIRRAGGHLFVSCKDRTGARFTAAAFEPTKGFRDAVGALRAGDRITVVGPVEDGTVRLEKLRVVALANVLVKEANPVCPECGKRMKSAGAGAGYRCRTCGTEAPPDAADLHDEARTLKPGWLEVPVGARRHLHRPVAWTMGL